MDMPVTTTNRVSTVYEATTMVHVCVRSQFTGLTLLLDSAARRGGPVLVRERGAGQLVRELICGLLDVVCGLLERGRDLLRQWCRLRLERHLEEPWFGHVVTNAMIILD